MAGRFQLNPPAEQVPGVHQGLGALGRRVPAQGGARHRPQFHPPHAAAPGNVHVHIVDIFVPCFFASVYQAIHAFANVNPVTVWNFNI